MHPIYLEVLKVVALHAFIQNLTTLNRNDVQVKGHILSYSTLLRYLIESIMYESLHLRNEQEYTKNLMRLVIILHSI